MPGFQQFRRSDARSANPTSQGVTLRALGGNASSRALLILDGVPQTDPFGGWVSWPAYDPQRLGAVRVTRGGGSGVDGPGALAGTIELDSAGPDELRGADRRSLALWQPRQHRRPCRARRAARRRLRHRCPAPMRAATASSRSSRRSAARSTAPRPTSRRASRCARWRRSPATIELQASGLAFTDRRERGTAFSGDRARTGADASLRLVGRGACASRRSATSRPATSPTASPASMPRAPPSPRPRPI